MTDLHTICGEVHNFGPLQDSDEQGTIRVVHTPRGDEIRWVLGHTGAL